MNTSQLESLLNWRYAVRKFSEQTIAQDKVDKLIELTGLSASAFGLQPYKIIQISKQSIKKHYYRIRMDNKKCLIIVIY
ncbi:nitroreductase family protein [Pseudoalteromonas piscicida]|nr:nitroreductase family protein [Pseudoalteromonas piscicida]WMO16492.1 nitroreductase family protein [Pseudoalteromonas piscicida]